MLNRGGGFKRTQRVVPQKAGERLAVECRHCFTHTDSAVMSVFTTPQNEWHRTPADMPIFNLLLRCTRCGGAMLMLWPFSANAVTNIMVEPRLYPIGSARDADKAYQASVPAAILEDLKQASACQGVAAVYGAALLYRRAIQYLCRDKKAPEKLGLKGQIANLAASGIITTHIKELAEHVRIIGNDIAHPDAEHPARIEWNDVKAASEFARQIVEAVYVGPYKAAELRKRLKEKGVPEA